MDTNQKAMEYLKTTIEYYKRGKSWGEKRFAAGVTVGATQALLMAGIITAQQAGEIDDLLNKA